MKNPFKERVAVNTVDGYFAIPKNKRSLMGLYLYPMSLRGGGSVFDSNTGNTINFLCEWDKFSSMIRKEYPIQGYFREWFFTVDNPVYFFIWKILDNVKALYYNLKRIIWPVAPRFRKVAPRWRYDDVCEIIREANFALIQDFWHEEVVDGFVDWNGDDHHHEFYLWIEQAIRWIEVEKPDFLKQISDEYDKVHGDSYKKNYAKIDEIEEIINKKDTEILTQMIVRRERFWT